MTGINSIILAGGSKTEIWPFSWEMCPMKIIEVQFGELMEEGIWKKGYGRFDGYGRR
ncbi:hypothetical protein [Methanosarcina sp. 1.H.A.2.2]|uniref:hypothetical protein n=1 Tax=Methanosarcina sp. 1.H.A.2.2 TaxID=1483601 RepID=UPI001910B95A|nr:hypothetical protein [Methanosarcina sp. 1.H.A.2.2]